MKKTKYKPCRQYFPVNIIIYTCTVTRPCFAVLTDSLSFFNKQRYVSKCVCVCVCVNVCVCELRTDSEEKKKKQVR